MQEDFLISDAPAHSGEEVTVSGWVRHLRTSGKIAFIEVRDGTGLMQAVVVKNQVPGEIFERVKELKIESAVRVTGVIREDSRAPGGYEMAVRELEVLQVPDDDYPLSKKEHGTDFLLENRHLWLRSSRQLAILRVRSELIRLLREFFHQRGFVLIDTPILTGSIGENAGNLFKTPYFDLGEAYLAQTGQLYLEAACTAFRKVFCLGPTFRAEKSKTRRHLTEFWMLEAEVAFNDSEANMRLQEEMIGAVVPRVAGACEEELRFLERDPGPLKSAQPPFPRLSYDQAVELLREKGFRMAWGEDIGGDEETAVSESFGKPVFIYNYPRQVKAFYMQPNPDDPRTVLNDDLLAPEGYGEIIGGSQRNDDLSSLVERIREEGLDPESYRWYLDLRRYGSVPHAGFGLGIERLLSWVCGLHHVREAIPFPRLINRLTP
ncbi:MAG: asparagine--tRNA ligase [Spirochaetota bacterium]